MSAQRTPREVIDDHLRLAQEWDLETDLERNFARNVVLLTSYGVFRGSEGVRKAFRLLDEQMPNGRWTYRTVMVEGEMGFLEWTGEADNGARVEDGADSYLIRDGKIRSMTIHYTVQSPRQERGRSPIRAGCAADHSGEDFVQSSTSEGRA